jgi:hypothetical protein
MISRIHNLWLTAPLVLAMGGLGLVRGQDARVENQELKATLQAAAGQIQDLQNKAEKLKQQINTLSESLASANADGAQAREAYEKLRLQMEGLGIAVLDGSNGMLQQQMLSALSDLRILEGHRRALTQALIDLSEASIGFAKSSPNSDVAAKESLNKALAAGEKALAGTKLVVNDAAQSGELHDARIVSLKDDLGIVVFNVGSHQGVHPGMPFSVFRGDKPVARALVVDVRQNICGALVRELVSKDEPVKIGDSGRVETSKG